MKKIFNLSLAIFLFLLAACQLLKPRFINHPQPNLSISFDAFADVGCSAGVCNDESPMTAFGCDEIQQPSSLLGGLEPSYPIALCIITPRYEETPSDTQAEIDNGQFIYFTGGLFGVYVRYVVHKDDGFVLLKTEDEFRTLYAPIESPEEALSYTLALTNLSAYYGLQHDPAYKYEVNTIEDTYVVAETDGYRLHLYAYQEIGCGPHWISAAEVHLTSEGVIQEVNWEPLFRDPNIDDLCID